MNKNNRAFIVKLLSVLKIPFHAFYDLFKMVLIYLPGPTGIRLRRIYYQRKLKSCGENLIVEVGVSIEGAWLISIGSNVFIDKYCQINTGTTLSGSITIISNSHYKGDVGCLTIGDGVHIAPFCSIVAYGGVKIDDLCGLSSGVKIYSFTNTPVDLKDKTKVVSVMPVNSHDAPYLLSPVVLEKNTWIALNSIIMPNTSIGENSFATSNSLISGRFKSNSYISGQPAKRIKDRFLQKPQQG